ncbi:protein FADD [Heptranchias perlo]|uniref:protein FADD n=1 Tax=Heptranchias perlo TaxID=212740 RepID=UPI0035597015
MAGPAGMEFNAMLNNISQDLSADNLESLKFLCKESVGKRQLETISSGNQLFQALEERSLLSPEDTHFLSVLLKNIKRPDLENQLSAFQRGHGQLQQPVCEVGADTERLEAAFEVICSNIGKDWRMFARKLGHKEALLQQIQYRYPSDMREQILQALREWQRVKGEDATVDMLVKVLRSCRLNMVADTVEEEVNQIG